MIFRKPYVSVDDTVKNIISLIKRSSDCKCLDYFKGKTLQEIFDFISKEIKYVPDPMEVRWLDGGNIELLRSPKYTLYEAAGDCDDKHILAGAIFYSQKIPVRIVIMSNKPEKKFHHVYIEIYVNGEWKPFDATYPENKLFDTKFFTKKRIYEETADGIKTNEIEN
jgi:hypothetical protein